MLKKINNVNMKKKIIFKKKSKSHIDVYDFFKNKIHQKITNNKKMHELYNFRLRKKKTYLKK